MLLRHGPGGWLPDVTTFYYRLAIVRFWLRAYLGFMTYRNALPIVATKISPLQSLIAAGPSKPTNLVRSALRTAFFVFVVAGIAIAAELPEAPSSSSRNEAAAFEATTPVYVSAPAATSVEVKPIDKKFVSLALISTGSTFADSYTTLFARENWLAGKKGVCNVEVESAYLYGTHPTVGRAYAVASAKAVTSVAAAYFLRRHHSRFWSLPLVANSVISLQGVSQNMATCN